MAVVQDPTVQRRRLRVELRKARDAAGRKQADVARAMDWSPSKLIRIESGQVSISTNDLKALLNYYGVKDMARVNNLLELAKSARGSSFYDQFADLLKPGWKEWLAYEASASVIRQYDPVYVPGLMQVEEYARAVLRDAVGLGHEDVDRAWAIREHRQGLHEREDPPDMLFVLDEAALRRQVGTPKVLYHQLERLRDYATQTHLSLQILPFSRGAHPGMLGNFIMLEFDDPDLADMVHLESVNEITVRDDTEVISRYLDRFLRLEELALSPDESLAMLDDLIKEQSTTKGASTPARKAAG
jgi:transcriptional regulator with XRE-family HTH domain